jgi:hypothetical protein
MPTLVLPPRFTEDTNLVRKAAIEAGWDVERLSGWQPPPELRNADPVLYGEPLFAAVVADTLGLSLIEPPFHWLTTLSDHWTCRQIRFTTLGDARNECHRMFIKPADDKCFPARVYESGSELPSTEILPDETPVLISEPVRWGVEFRCFVLRRELQTHSIYSRDGELAQREDGTWDSTATEHEQAQEFICDLLADHDVAIPPATVIDIGMIVDRGWAVVESNPAWGSGIYGCDPSLVLGVIRRTCLARDHLTPADAEWVPIRSP